MKLGNINWFKDSFLFFLLIFIFGVLGVFLSQKLIDKNSADYISILVQKNINETETADIDTPEINESSNSQIITTQFIGSDDLHIQRDLTADEARKLNAEYERIHRTQTPTLNSVSNYFASLMSINEREQATVMRDELLVILSKTDDHSNKSSDRATAYNNLAFSYEKEDNINFASEYYRKALSLQSNWFSHFGLASLAIKKKLLVEAKSRLAQALELVPAEEKYLLYYSFAEKLSDENYFQEAHDTHSVVMSLKSDYWPSYLGQAVALRKLKRYDEAEKIYNSLLLAQPNYAKAHFNYGLLLNRLQRPNDAIKEFNTTLLIDESHQRARRVLADTYFDIKSYEKSYSQFKILHRRNLREPRYLYWMGRIDLTLKNYEKAEGNFRKAIELKGGDYPDAWSKMADLYLETKRDKEARKVLEDLIRLHPDLASAYYDLASTVEVSENNDKALELVQMAVKLKPSSQIYRRKLASLLEDRGDVNSALKQLNLALAEDDKNINTITRLGELLTRMKNYSAANAQFQHVLSMNAKKSVVWFNYGQNQSRLGNCNSAIKSFGEALKSSDQQDNQFMSKVFRQRASCYKKVKNLSMAKSDLRDAIQLRENYSEARVDLAEILLTEKSTAEANKVVSDGLALDENNCWLMKFSLASSFGVTQTQWDEKCGPKAIEEKQKTKGKFKNNKKISEPKRW